MIKETQSNNVNKFSLCNLNYLVYNPMGGHKSHNDKTLVELSKGISSIYKEMFDKDFKVTVIPVSHTHVSQLAASILIVCLENRNNDHFNLAYHTLIIEDSIDPITSKYEIVDGVTVEILRTTSDIYDKITSTIVSTKLYREYPLHNAFFTTGACVVPRDFNVSDINAVYRLATNIMIALSTELELRNPNFTDINLANTLPDCKLIVKNKFVNESIENDVGQPVRNDIQIDLIASPNDKTRYINRDVLISRVSGFVDLVKHPIKVNKRSKNRNFQQYGARFIITALDQHQASTPCTNLLSLVSTASIIEDNKWIETFKLNEKNKSIIGAINYEVNFEGNKNGIGDCIDVNNKIFKDEHLYKLISSTISSGLILSLDISECGPDTWYNDVFACAATGNEYANDVIIYSANCLTDGNFSKYFSGNDDIFTEVNRIHLGYYTDATGLHRDIRNVDYLIILNALGNRDLQYIKDWAAASKCDGFKELSYRKRIISAILDNVVFTGFATRVTFNPKFITALTIGCKEAGLNIFN